MKIEELKAALTKYSGYVTSEITKHAFGSSREGDWYKLWTDVTDFVWPTLLQDRQQRDAPSSSNLALDEGREVYEYSHICHRSVPQNHRLMILKKNP